MPRFCANLTYLFTERPVLERPAAAKAAGFAGVEILFPYEEPAAQVAEAARLAGTPVVMINAPPPNWAGGPRGFAAVPGGEAQFEKDFRRALRFAEVLKTQHLHLMAGIGEGPEARATLLRNLRWAAEQAPGQSLVVEPVNAVDVPGYFLNDFHQAMDILAEAGTPNLGLLFDTYQAHAIHGDVPALWQTCREKVAHVQVAGVPGRSEPDRCDIDYPAFFKQLDEGGYHGWVGAEYRPGGATDEGLAWLRRALRSG